MRSAATVVQEWYHFQPWYFVPSRSTSLTLLDGNHDSMRKARITRPLVNLTRLRLKRAKTLTVLGFFQRSVQCVSMTEALMEGVRIDGKQTGTARNHNKAIAAKNT
jgi:hypothetical protein